MQQILRLFWEAVIDDELIGKKSSEGFGVRKVGSAPGPLV
jgi:hypothetical protein